MSHYLANTGVGKEAEAARGGAAPRAFRQGEQGAQGGIISLPQDSPGLLQPSEVGLFHEIEWQILSQCIRSSEGCLCTCSADHQAEDEAEGHLGRRGESSVAARLLVRTPYGPLYVNENMIIVKKSSDDSRDVVISIILARPGRSGSAPSLSAGCTRRLRQQRRPARRSSRCRWRRCVLTRTGTRSPCATSRNYSRCSRRCSRRALVANPRMPSRDLQSVSKCCGCLPWILTFSHAF